MAGVVMCDRCRVFTLAATWYGTMAMPVQGTIETFTPMGKKRVLFGEYTAQCEMTDFLYVQNGTFMTRLRCQLQLYHTRPSRYKRLYWSHSHGEIQQPLTAGQCGMAGIDTTAATRPGDNATVRWSVVQ